MAECNGCTKCCEALHLTGRDARKLWNPEKVERLRDGKVIRSLFLKISKRRAKKINPYLFKRQLTPGEKVFMKTAKFFKCKALEVGVGCKVHDTRPHVCRIYDGGNEYTDNCAQLIPVNNI